MGRITSKVFEGQLRNHLVLVPEEIRKAPGIKVFGRRIKSLVFTTDVCIIRNTDADAVLAVYPFTPQPVITQSIIDCADIPVFTGVGGGTTQGKRVVNLALDAEFKGAIGVVVNAPTINETIREMAETIDIPIVVTVVSELEDIEARLLAGASILNISGASKTPDIIRHIKKHWPDVPVIATGGPSSDSINETIDAGADAITYTPPTNGEIFRARMDIYRTGLSPEKQAK